MLLIIICMNNINQLLHTLQLLHTPNISIIDYNNKKNKIFFVYLVQSNPYKWLLLSAQFIVLLGFRRWGNQGGCSQWTEKRKSWQSGAGIQKVWLGSWWIFIMARIQTGRYIDLSSFSIHDNKTTIGSKFVSHLFMAAPQD